MTKSEELLKKRKKNLGDFFKYDFIQERAWFRAFLTPILDNFFRTAFKHLENQTFKISSQFSNYFLKIVHLNSIGNSCGNSLFFMLDIKYRSYISHLWSMETLRCCKVPKYYVQDCSREIKCQWFVREAIKCFAETYKDGPKRSNNVRSIYLPSCQFISIYKTNCLSSTFSLTTSAD